ncbi:MAG: UDP-N-acetylmuramate--L-alanine ligase [Candidatus Staskawiczbacteria bacterium RIFCSPLOWO2_01_FULL_37_25b]|uniref:UDP-N-acetylmuramate--L-alanine ligase n=2 Tax=Candidatus Staskawicziibacteriota TaxID=1817916 RepID=A0A1G2HSE2_9BACT|nr:MAG: UDP-N-acetylmuramate--L-alanine ligase [Candidatus Staskawiczbacteria bacterium RIFCSPHIGHO2_01_FULL_36_16]OGZ73627.1 MAG: UDP-N-acetylmuramate--L-alanine ligase [Candidatus Staskawiczbacteria bacterium RIFCSPLOWO2_01_FULL_37_25b]
MKVHFIGIGGIGVSALVQYYLSKGNEVSGSDLARSEITDFLKKLGAKIYIGNFSKNIQKDFDLIIYSPAAKKNNPELKRAKSRKIKTMSYPEALGELTKEYFTIAVSGTHGKSTTASMMGLAFEKAGLDPTVIVGTKVKEFGNSNFRAGKSKTLVIEADEHFASFLNYWPKIIVLTNIEREHLDYYKNLKNILNAYKKYAGHLGRDGFLVFNEDDENIKKVVSEINNPQFKTEKYGFLQKESVKLKKILKIPGKHNIYNALAVLAVARILRIPDEITFKSLSEFKGTWRRFEIKKGKAKKNQITIVSDYGHHPTEVLATLEAVREKYPKKTIWCIFQPHQRQRTYYLFNDFVKVFREAPIDNIIITDIYDVAGRETKKIKAGVSSKKLVKKIKKDNIRYFAPDKAEKYVKENIKSGDALVIMGAGDIYKLADKF